VAVVGGGPAGLYFSALWKSRHPTDEVRLFEQNAADATWGFGVVFSDQALEFLRDDDPDTVDAIAPHMQAWRDITIVHRGQPVAIDGVGFSAIGRLQLLQLLQRRAGDAGVVLQFGHAVQSMAELAGRPGRRPTGELLVRRAFEGVRPQLSIRRTSSPGTALSSSTRRRRPSLPASPAPSTRITIATRPT
jgi:2-polyprenyl-6-methoxyphenol hydroxylase-like FAD-dependent oxidoreductase